LFVLLAGPAIVERNGVSGALTKMALATHKETAVCAVVDVTTSAASRKTVAEIGILAARIPEKTIQVSVSIGV
jgi:hypothetical protein